MSSREKRRRPSRETRPEIPEPSAPGRSRRFALALGGAALAAVVALLAILPTGGPDGSGADSSPFPRPDPAARSAIGPGDFAGPEACGECHSEETDRWRSSTHGRAGGEPASTRVLPPFDGRPILFRDATVIPRTTPVGALEFVVRWLDQAPDTLRVDGIVGGGHMEGGGTQGFFSRWEDGTVRFLPFDYSRHADAWFCNVRRPVPGHWLPITPQLFLSQCADWPPNRVLGSLDRFVDCEQCHGSRIRAGFDPGERRYETEYASLAIDCESCHGPARAHVELARSGRLAGSEDIGLGSLAVLGEDESLDVCWRCHATKLVLRPDDLPGMPLEESFSLLLPVLTDRPYTADNRIAGFGYQLGHLGSDCYLNGSMTCVSCHEPHGQGYQDAFERPLVGRLDDGQCTSCHVSKADRVPDHTRHGEGSPGSRCVSCHMPYLQHPSVGDGIPYGRSDHTIPLPRPGDDEALGVTSACALCHADVPVAELAERVQQWYGTLKPRPALVRGIVEAGRTNDRVEGARLLLRPGDAFPMAQMQALSQFAVRFLDVEMADLEAPVVEALEALAAGENPDVSALALASLHLSQGHLPAIRTLLAGSLAADTGRTAPLRPRWIRALSYLGDVRAFRGDPATAAVIYRKALELDADDVEVTERLGAALAGAGVGDEAEELLRKAAAMATDPSTPLVELGLALESRGSLEAAADAYRRATEANPWNGTAFFRLGNVHLRRRDLPPAGEAFATARTLDPAMAPARVGLAQVLVSSGDLDGARRELMLALAFDPGNSQARQLLRGIDGAP